MDVVHFVRKHRHFAMNHNVIAMVVTVYKGLLIKLRWLDTGKITEHTIPFEHFHLVDLNEDYLIISYEDEIELRPLKCPENVARRY